MVLLLSGLAVLVLLSHHFPSIREKITHFGILHRLIPREYDFIDTSTSLHVGTLNYFSRYRGRGVSGGNPPEFAGKIFSANFPKSCAKSNRDQILFLSRTIGYKRSVVNQRAIVDAINADLGGWGLAQPLKVRLLMPDEYENIDYFLPIAARSVAVIGPHGAQMVNAIFTCPRTHVIEYLCVSDPPESASYNHYSMFEAYNKTYGALALECTHSGQYASRANVDETLELLKRMITQKDDGS